MTEMLNDREKFARNLRTVADRIEDGEYNLSQIELQRPSPDGDSAGRFGIEFYTTEELERMAYAFQEETNL